jgi:hypothetical protein
MALSGMSRAELEETLSRLKRLHDATRRNYDQKFIEYDEMARELNSLAESLKSIKGSMTAIERDLGLSSEQIRLPDLPEVKVGKPMDTTETVMRLIAAKNESGGITFDEILQALRDKGIKVTREYLHTILNRKKNYQKKLIKQNGKWLLTDLGKQELGIE